MASVKQDIVPSNDQMAMASEATQNTPNPHDVSNNEVMSPPHSQTSTSDTYISDYLSKLAKFDGQSTIHRNESERRAAKFVQRFVKVYCPSENDEFDDSDDSDDEAEKNAIYQALRNLIVSVTSSDPSATREYMPHYFSLPSRFDKGRMLLPADPVIDALNKLHLVAPSLLSFKRGNRTTTDALPRELVRHIAHNRIECWKTAYDRTAEDLIKSSVNWWQVHNWWREIWRNDGIWIDETVFRILCAIPLRGGPRIAHEHY